MEKCLSLSFLFFLFVILLFCSSLSCRGVSSVGPQSSACAAAMEDIVTNGYTSPNYNGPPGNNDCTRWGRYWITCIGSLTGPCACAMAIPPGGMGTCALYADIVLSMCTSACGGSVLAANMGPNGNPDIRLWGSLMRESITGVGII